MAVIQSFPAIRDEIACDFRIGFGRASLLRNGDRLRLSANGVIWAQTDSPAYPHMHRVKWIDAHSVLLWPTRLDQCAAAIIRADAVQYVDVGFAWNVAITERHILVTYGEQALIAASPDDREANLISVFSREGSFLFGLSDLLGPGHERFIEVSALCVRGEAVTFSGYDTPYLWTLYPESRSVSQVPLGSSRNGIMAMIGAGNLVVLLRREDWHLILDEVMADDGTLIRSEMIAIETLFNGTREDPRRLIARELGNEGFLVSLGQDAVVVYPELPST